MKRVKFDTILAAKTAYLEGRKSFKSFLLVVEFELHQGGVPLDRAFFEAAQYCHKYETK